MKIPLVNSDLYALADSDLAELLIYTWHLFPARSKQNRHYARRYEKGKQILMHRQIMETHVGRKLKRSEEVIHLNLDGLDNRLENLRIANASERSRNRAGYGRSKYKGVVWRPDRDCWRVRLKVRGKSINGGHYATEEEAARAANILLLQVYGPDARFNSVYGNGDD